MKKIKNLCLLIMLCWLPNRSFGQLVHVELMGATPLYSVNYDNRFSEKSKLGFRAGFGITSGFESFSYVPLQINYVSKQTHGLEVGIGITISNPTRRFFPFINNADVFQTVTLAYRFPSKNRIKIRAGFTSYINVDVLFPWSIFWPTFSVGYQF